MVVFAVKVEPDEKLKQLIEDYNFNLENNDKYLSGELTLKENILIVYIKNHLSPIDLPKLISFWQIKYKWKHKGYNSTFRLLSDQKLLEMLLKWGKKK